MFAYTYLARHNIQKLIILIVATAFLMLSISNNHINVYAVTQEELKSQISTLKNNALSINASKSELQNQLLAIQGDKAKVLEQKRLLDQQLNIIESEINNAQEQIDIYSLLIEEQEEELQVAQAKERSAYERFCQRVRAMEEAGNISYWSVILSAKSWSDFLDQIALVNRVVAYDNSVIDTLIASRQEIEVTLSELNQTMLLLEQQKAQKELKRIEQAQKVAEVETVFDELKKRADVASALVAAQEAEEQKISTEISKKERELKKLIDEQKVSFTTGSGYVYPLPAANVIITSQFGPRIHPITKKYHSHSGADISAPGGTNIFAVQGGKVVTSAYAASSYGEYVVIDHGNGRTTLYAHMQLGSRKVKEGDIVAQGQIIGLVGMTGSATGNHLHLELRVNSVRENPLALFPSIPFEYR